MVLAVLVPALPLLGWAALGLGGGRWGPRVVAWVACGTVAGSFLAALGLWAHLVLLPPDLRQVPVDLYRWFAVGSLVVPLQLLVDPLSVAMALVVSGVGALIHIYSVGYMAGDADFARYFAYMNLFMAAMLLLALAGNLVVMFIGWEGVGLCSYLLISFWFTRPAAARAGVKAFLVTRLGDVGFLLGIFLALGLFGTTDFRTMTAASSRLPLGGPAATTLALLLFAGAVGKSAQLPLYVWLPDAMEGPTPVSALIHAATMVTAGVYMVLRLHAVYLRAPLAMDVVALVGAVTAVFAAALAWAEPDLKRVLAYSTISQLGYMFLGVGVGAWGAGFFHLTSHAFFKALLFLAVGAVMHALGGVTDMRAMGGLAPRLPRTAAAFAVGALALGGIPPFVGFFSKERILSEVYLHGARTLWILGLAGSALTAVYIVRAFVLTFVAPPSGSQEGGGLHDPPPVMLGPMAGLALLATIGGVLGWSFDRWFRPAVGPGAPAAGAEEGALVAAGLGVAVLGVALAWLAYTRGAGGARFPAVETVLARQFYVEDLYNLAVVEPLRAMSRWAAQVDRRLIDGAVVGVGRLVGAGGGLLRRAQTGYLRHYAAFVLAGALLLLVYWVWR